MFHDSLSIRLSRCRDQNLEEINVLRITLDTQIEDLEQHFETAHINYLQVPYKDKDFFIKSKLRAEKFFFYVDRCMFSFAARGFTSAFTKVQE